MTSAAPAARFLTLAAPATHAVIDYTVVDYTVVDYTVVDYTVVDYTVVGESSLQHSATS